MVTEFHARHILVRVDDTHRRSAGRAPKIDTLRGAHRRRRRLRQGRQERFAKTPARKAQGRRPGLVPARRVRPGLRQPGRGARRRPGVRAVPHRRRLAHRPAPRHAPDRRQRPEPPRADPRDDRPPQARGRVRTASCAKCAAKPSSTCASAEPPTSPRSRRPPTPADAATPRQRRLSDTAAARAGPGRAGRHRPGTVRAARAAAARRIARWPPSPIRAPCRRPPHALGLPLRLLDAGRARRAPGELALRRDPAMPRPSRSATPIRRNAAAVIAALHRPARGCLRRRLRRPGHRPGAQGQRSTPAASPTPAPPNCSPSRPAATW